FIVVWLAAPLGTRRTVQRETPRSRFSYLVVEIAGYYLLFAAGGMGFLNQRLIPGTPLFVWAGVVCTWAGIALAIWARWSLGRNWSARITLKEGHELIRSGPYRYFRHPIYSGLDLAVVGGALAIGRWRCLLGAALVIAGYWMKARREEALLRSQFGPAFEEHVRETGFLLPKV
ncbi:MAG: isoprenylcysteine carboxylmethyltransferase family protein, partial [Acidobacteriales bacterium]|nr:isoprenylcysteine carboxylmethyltransferase family protein [Terriglobales bacterium]